MSSFSGAVEKAWYGNAAWTRLLLPLSWAFGFVTRIRRTAFRRGWFASGSAGVPTLVVGNIVAGGAGKTPIVIAVANELAQAGLRVGVVSRGYGRSTKGVLRVQASATSEQVGDEPKLIERETGALVFVGEDRLAAARAAVSSGAQIIVSDDGLQHYRMRRDLELVCSDAEVGFGNGYLFPAGPLREPLSRLGSIDYFLQRGGSDPHSASEYRPRQLRNLQTGQSRPLTQHDLEGPIHAVAAIARPARFFATLRELGFEFTPHAFADHAALTVDSFAGFAQEPIIMTTKDAVKCEKLPLHNAWVLDMELQFPEGFMERLVADCLSLRSKQA